MDKKISNVKYELIASVSENLKEVMVTYTQNGQSHRYFVFVPKNNKMKDSDYIKEAKKKFEAEAKAGKIKPKKIRGGRNRPWLIATTCVLGVATLALGGLFVWNLLSKDSGEKKISYEDAQKWLDERASAAINLTVQSGDFSWDYSKSTGDSLKEIGMPTLMSYLIDSSTLDEGGIAETTETKMDNFNYIGWRGSRINFVEQRDGEALRDWIKENSPESENNAEPKPSKCVIKDDKLHVTFIHDEGLPTKDGVEYHIQIEETDVYDKNGVSTEVIFNMDNVKIDYPGGPKKFPLPKFSGTANGHVDAKFNLSKYDAAYRWFDYHYYKSEVDYRIIKSIDYKWDFSETTDKNSQNFIKETLKTGTGIERDVELVDETKVIPLELTAYALEPDEFGSYYEYAYRSLFEMSENEMLITNTSDNTIYFFQSLGLVNKHIAKYDADCYLNYTQYEFDHSTDTDGNIEITGSLTRKIVYEEKK